MIRNLIYNCWPALHTDEWSLNLERLSRYAGAFNGRRLVLLKRGGPSGVLAADADTVRRKLAPLGEFEIIEYENNPELGETVGFVDALERLQSTNPNEALFYAHTKGVRYTADIPLQNLTAIRRWRNRMYEECLSDVGRIERVLEDHACCGCFLQHGDAPPVPSAARWHFAGTFWWVRHDALFRAAWRDVDAHTHGVEGYLGKLFPIEHAHCLHSMPSHHRGGLYAVECFYRCDGCGHEFKAFPKMSSQPTKVCPRCFKRKGRLDRIAPDPIDEL